MICSGFYKELKELKKDNNEADFGFLKSVVVTSESNAFNFLHGCCDEFAAMLSDSFGYEVECVRNANHRLIHAYCVSYIGSEKVYIDVRGMTTDKKLFFEEFENELTYYAPEDVCLVEDDEGYELEADIEISKNKNEMFDGDLEGWTDEDIVEFICLYRNYYDVTGLKRSYICSLDEQIQVANKSCSAQMNSKTVCKKENSYEL